MRTSILHLQRLAVLAVLLSSAAFTQAQSTPEVPADQAVPAVAPDPTTPNVDVVPATNATEPKDHAIMRRPAQAAARTNATKLAPPAAAPAHRVARAQAATPAKVRKELLAPAEP